MQPSGILETALYCHNLDETASFYAELLGLEEIARVQDRHVFFRCGTGVLLLFNAAMTVVPPPANARFPVPPHGTTGQGHICFRASEEEIDQWKTRLAQAGIEIETELTWPSGGRSIYLRDPAGNSVEFANPSIWNFDL